MTLTVEPFMGQAAEWNTFVGAVRGGTIFHRHEWRDIIEHTFGHECTFLCARSPERGLVGVLPQVRVRSRLFGDYLVSMPFVNYGGPLGSADAVRELVARAVDMARRWGVDLLELRSSVQLPLDLPISHRKVTVMLDLPGDGSEALWQTLKAKVRSQVRRPRKEGLTVHFGLDQLSGFYAVFAEHMRDLGTPVLPRGWFERILESFSEQVWVACVRSGTLPVAAGWGFHWDDQFELTWASSLRRCSAMAPNMLLYWAFMERCCEQGVRRFNFGRCTPGSGTHRFKLQWGGHDEPLWWYQDARDGRAGTPSPTDSRYAWGPRLWSRLPLPIANAVGPRIVRFIP